ncbi:MAG: LysM peptidoglycan-binding domain-containing protein [Pirellulales bacterium]|nr:LysM peptidoglycan-binding domain-containing protein [Pirellulales bacterium]
MDTPRPAYRLSSNARVAAAAVIVFVGILAALLFRSEVTPPPSDANDLAAPVIERASDLVAASLVTSTIEAEPRDSRPRLTGTIEPSSDASAAPSTESSTDHDPDSADPGMAASWRITDLGSAPLPGGAGLVPRNPDNTVYGSHREDESRRTHKVVDGDTLIYLAERYLGDGSRYLEIYEANRDVLRDPDLLVLGAMLRIPAENAPPPSADEHFANVAKRGGLVPVSNGDAAPVVAAPVSSPLALPAAAPVAAPMTEITRPGQAPPPAASLGAPDPSPATTSVSIDSASFTRPQTYRVQAGDTLVDIARRVYGDARRYLDIYNANRDRLQRPQDLREGLILTIP